MPWRRELILVAILATRIFGCPGDASAEQTVEASSRAYKGHENDADIANLIRVYPAAAGSRLDDCQTCHTGEVRSGVQTSNACDYCHKLMLQDSGHTYQETLNPYGLDYLNAGRSKDAIQTIKVMDSDGDGSSNEQEIAAGRYPGNAASKPGQKTMPLRIVPLDRVKAMPSHSEFLLVNANKQPVDDYAGYRGVKIRDFLAGLGIDPTGVTGITILAPDGYAKSYPIDEVTRRYPRPIFYSGLDVATKGPDCGFVSYPTPLPADLVDGSPIPGEHYVLLAYECNGTPLEPCRLDARSGHIDGGGPLRLVVPQSKPGSPDRGSKNSPSPCKDGFDYDATKDHNAGAMVRGVIGIRIDPVPAGLEAFDHMNGGWAYIDSKQLIVYGHGVK